MTGTPVGEVDGGTTPPELADEPDPGGTTAVCSDDEPDCSTDDGKLSGSSY